MRRGDSPGGKREERPRAERTGALPLFRWFFYLSDSSISKSNSNREIKCTSKLKILSEYYSDIYISLMSNLNMIHILEVMREDTRYRFFSL
jgi:hypothetical protein